MGIVKLNQQDTVDQARLTRMRDVLRHRGPDGDGLWIDGPVGLGMRRLAIVDVAGGRQPMSNEDGTVWLVYNGEIYNHADLRSELSRRGHHYRTRSDTETILHLYEEDGERCVERLQGMFAFALWDTKRGRLLLARDRLGIKPLYYAWTEHELVFASEVKAILAGGSVRPALNHSIVPEFLAMGFVAGEETFFRGVRKLLPGRTLTWSWADGPRQRRYWRMPVATENGSAGSLEASGREVRARLADAVRSHLMSDVPLGLFLSGGMDSSGLAALMAPMVTEPIRTFSVGFSDAEANELAYARLAARSVGAEHRELVVAPAEFFGALPQLVWHEDEPIRFPSSVPLYFVSRLARDHVKVVLTGEGADELFLGYDRYRVTAWNERLGRFYWALTPHALQEGVKALARRLPRPVRRYATRTFLALGPSPRDLFYENWAIFPVALQPQLLSRLDLLTARDPYADGLRAYEEAGGGTLERMSHADVETYLVRLLMKQDQMSMAASVESRVPYLDHQFVEHIAALPPRSKLRGWRTKAVLRTALRDLVPREILTRRKMGFPVPVNRWFRDGFWPVVDEFVLGRRALARGLFRGAFLRRLADEHRAGTWEHGLRLWLLVNLEIWQRIFVDGEDVAHVMRPLEGRCASSG
ncbi:MAG TPA: asparagine synthase (glutamine-hydrolyzing) [Gemmatimonadales bacterium]|nr:asparagine synthase (glutamine-hydrolyzing) [Gemmatimonadales bacterium]